MLSLAAGAQLPGHPSGSAVDHAGTEEARNAAWMRGQERASVMPALVVAAIALTLGEYGGLDLRRFHGLWRGLPEVYVAGLDGSENPMALHTASDPVSLIHIQGANGLNARQLFANPEVGNAYVSGAEIPSLGAAGRVREKPGAPDRTRSCDTQFRKGVLQPLSYWGNRNIYQRWHAHGLPGMPGRDRTI